MGPLADKLQERFSYGDYLKWDDGERWELIDGIPYNMTPAPSRMHQKISGELFRQLANYLQGKPCEVYGAPFDVRLPVAEEVENDISTVVQPDIAVICDPAKLDPAGCIGAPDLIIEIISPSTARKDHKEKFVRYERARVQEYWLIDPVARTATIFMLGNDSRYGRPEVYGDDETISVGIFQDLSIDLSLVFCE